MFMADWLVLSQTVTAKGEAREFETQDVNGELVRAYMIAAERQGSGGDDSIIPRRAVGMGPTRRDARRSLEDTITRYQPSGRVVFSR